MNIKTFRAKSVQQALDMVRRQLGPEATVLHTRELNPGLMRRLLRGREYEIAASLEVRAPVRMATVADDSVETPVTESYHETNYRDRYRNDFRLQREGQFAELHELSEKLRERSSQSPIRRLPEALFQAYTDLIESEIEESIAQELLEQLRTGLGSADPLAVRAELMSLIERELQVTGPLEVSPGAGRVVALVGPTGVGKTTTIAKLAANYRLRENKSVGLITVDTYRIAAVEQLRTYADIIDLPMEVVSTPREMREAVLRMRNLDLVLMDTAGRSPRDEVRIQELKSILAEADPDEVHLVLSAVGSARSLSTTAERFASVGTTAMIVTKLDEANGLGNLLSVTRGCKLPISYLTDGQNVPDDIQVAQSRALAQLILGIK